MASAKGLWPVIELLPLEDIGQAVDWVPLEDIAFR